MITVKIKTVVVPARFVETEEGSDGEGGEMVGEEEEQEKKKTRAK